MARRVLLTAVVSTVLVLLLAVAPAGAHLRSGTVAVDYRASMIDPQTDAYSAQIFQSDRALSVTVRPGHSVVLLGYLSEPVFRLSAAGLWVNAASPTAAALRLVKTAKAGSSSAPRWLEERGRHSVIWPDSRSQGLPPGASHGLWSVPLIVDGHQARLEGELRRFPAPSLWLRLGILAAILAAAVSPLGLRRRDLAGPASIWFGVIAACACGVVLVAFALDAYASPGTWIEAVDATPLSLSVPGRCCVRRSSGMSPPRSVWGWLRWRWGCWRGPSSCTRSCSRSYQEPRPGLPTSSPSAPGWSLLGSAAWPTSSRAASRPPIRLSGFRWQAQKRGRDLHRGWPLLRVRAVSSSRRCSGVLNVEP